MGLQEFLDAKTKSRIGRIGECDWRMSKPKKRFRFDFTFEKIECVGEDKDGKFYKVRMVPDKRSWERTEVNGEKGYLNKFDKTFISDTELAKSVKTMKHIPITVSSTAIADEQGYIEKSKKRVKDMKE
jgi:hypothetical protein